MCLGPIQLPFIGSMVQLSLADPNPPVAMAKLAKKYGDVMSLKVGQMDAGIVNTKVEKL